MPERFFQLHLQTIGGSILVQTKPMCLLILWNFNRFASWIHQISNFCQWTLCNVLKKIFGLEMFSVHLRNARRGAFNRECACKEKLFFHQDCSRVSSLGSSSFRLRRCHQWSQRSVGASRYWRGKAVFTVPRLLGLVGKVLFTTRNRPWKTLL